MARGAYVLLLVAGEGRVGEDNRGAGDAGCVGRRECERDGEGGIEGSENNK